MLHVQNRTIVGLLFGNPGSRTIETMSSRLLFKTDQVIDNTRPNIRLRSCGSVVILLSVRLFFVKMWTLKLFLFSLAFVLASSEFQMPNLDAMGNILQTLKDNGMMDQFQDKFSQMFVKEKSEKKTNEDFNENSSNDPTFDVFDFTRCLNHVNVDNSSCQ